MLDEDQIQFLILINYLITFQGLHCPPTDSSINPKHLVDGWTPPSVNPLPVLVHRYPVIEKLLSLARLLVHEPQGQHAEWFRRYHRFASKVIFNSPATSSLDSEDSMKSSLLSSQDPKEHIVKSEDDRQPQLSECAPMRPPTPFPILDILMTKATVPSLSVPVTVNGTLITPPPSPPPVPNVSIDKVKGTENHDQTIKSPPSSPMYSPPDVLMEAPEVDSTQEGKGQPIDIENEDSDESDEESDEEISEEPQTEEEEESSQGLDADGWSAHWRPPSLRQIGFRSTKHEIDRAFQTLPSQSPGIIAYGPFLYPKDERTPLPSSHDYHIFIHPTNKCDVLDYFAYGGDGFKFGLEGRPLQVEDKPSRCQLAELSTENQTSYYTESKHTYVATSDTNSE